MPPDRPRPSLRHPHAPLLEWEQGRIPHLVVLLAEDDATIIAVTPHRQRDTTHVAGPHLGGIADTIARLRGQLDAPLIVMAGDHDRLAQLDRELELILNDHTRVVRVDTDLTTSAGLDQLAETTVRYVADAAACRTVEHLDELRDRLERGTAVQGQRSSIEQLSCGRAGMLLIHDDPDDQRQAWIGMDPARISIEPTEDTPRPTRLIDAAIQAAIAQGARVAIIPSTGPTGPTDNIAVTTRSQVNAN